MRTFKFVFGFPLLFLLGILFLSACGQLNKVTPSVNKLSIVLDKDQLEPSEMVTLNAKLEGFQFNVDRIEWTSDQGRFDIPSGNTALFTAPSQNGQVILQVRAIGPDALQIVTASLTVKVQRLDIVIPSIPQNLEAIASDNSLLLSWTMNTTEKIGGYRIYYSTAPDKLDHMIDVGCVSHYTLKNLINNQAYYIAIAAYDKSIYKNSSPVSTKISKMPIDIQPPATPAHFYVTQDPVSLAVDLKWENPTDSDFASIILRRSETGFPGRDDGMIICTGNTIESFTDTAVQAGVEYFYTIFAVDEIPLYSEPATRSIILIPTSNILPARIKK